MIPLLSIAIPTYNRAWCVGRAIESAIAQTCHDIEIIVSNNGSTDDTRRVIERYSDPRLRVIHRETTVSAGEHGNFIRRHCRGQYFVGLSDDDYLEPTFASRVIQAIQDHPGIPFIYTACVIHYGEVAVPSFHGPSLESSLDFLEGFISGRREAHWCSCATRLSDMLAVGDQPDSVQMGDLFYWMNIVVRSDSPVACVQEPLSHYTLMSDNISRTVPVYQWAAELRHHCDASLDQLAKGADPERVARVRRKISTLVANACADQLVWNALGRAPKRQQVRDALRSLRFLSREPTSWPRAAFGIATPAGIARRAIIATARRRAATGRMIWEDLQSLVERVRPASP